MHPDLLAALSSASTDSDHLVLGDPSLLWCKHMSSTCHGRHSLPLRFWQFVDSTVACRGTDVDVAVNGKKGKCGQFVFNGLNVRGDIQGVSLKHWPSCKFMHPYLYVCFGSVHLSPQSAYCVRSSYVLERRAPIRSTRICHISVGRDRATEVAGGVTPIRMPTRTSVSMHVLELTSRSSSQRMRAPSTRSTSVLPPNLK